MNLDKVVSIIREKKGAILSLSQTAQNSQYTTEQWNKEEIKIFNSFPEGFPRWAETEIRGYSDGVREVVMRFHIIHGGYIDGKFFSTVKTRDDYYEKLGYGPRDTYYNDTETGLYWGNVTPPKPYFISPKDKK